MSNLSQARQFIRRLENHFNDDIEKTDFWWLFSTSELLRLPLEDPDKIEVFENPFNPNATVFMWKDGSAIISHTGDWQFSDKYKELLDQG